MGRNTGTSMGPGFVRADYMARAPPLALHLQRDDQDDHAGLERIIHRFMTQVFSCCHLGGSMDFDSQGNLYFATGDNTGNNPNSTNGGYTNSHPHVHAPVPRWHRPERLRAAPAAASTRRTRTVTGHCRREHHARPTGTGSLAACGYISYGDARQTSGNTNAFEGKLLRIRPVNNPPAKQPGHRHHVHDPRA